MDRLCVSGDNVRHCFQHIRSFLSAGCISQHKFFILELDWACGRLRCSLHMFTPEECVMYWPCSCILLQGTCSVSISIWLQCDLRSLFCMSRRVDIVRIIYGWALIGARSIFAECDTQDGSDYCLYMRDLHLYVYWSDKLIMLPLSLGSWFHGWLIISIRVPGGVPGVLVPHRLCTECHWYFF